MWGTVNAQTITKVAQNKPVPNWCGSQIISPAPNASVPTTAYRPGTIADAYARGTALSDAAFKAFGNFGTNRAV